MRVRTIVNFFGKELPGLEDDGVPSSQAPRLNISATLPRESREGPFVERKRTEK